MQKHSSFFLLLALLLVMMMGVAFAENIQRPVPLTVQQSEENDETVRRAPQRGQRNLQPVPQNGYYEPNASDAPDSFDAMSGYMTDWSGRVGKRIMDHVRKSVEQNLQGQEEQMGMGTGGNSPQPAMDVLESQDEYVVKFDLPGVSKEDTQVEIKAGILSVSASHKMETEKTVKNSGYEYQKQERSSASFQRSVKLPSNVDLSQVKAEQKDGVLTVRFGKLKSEKPDVIKVTVQ
ncbi:MAG: Hsp20/alpha crystallin family protein [Candidatus Omnitrophica bacterium]|nr:Hsp20/alpha crystallin family protein [Candidatus Omnitrophota bacterium]